MSEEQQRLLAHRAIGTADSETRLAEWATEQFQVPVDEEDVTEALANQNVEMCPDCEWWCEAGELVDEDLETCACSSCR